MKDGMRKKNHSLRYPIMNFLLQRVVVQDLPADGHENRTRLGMLAGWTSAIMSAGLAVVKYALGMISGSVSMMADATNNLTDMCSSLVIALGFQWSRKPRDEDHPFGHGRIEAVTTLVMAIALILVGVEVARSGVMRLINPKPVEAGLWVMVAMAVTIAVKAWMAVFASKMAGFSGSTVLKADAWNHAFDVLSSLLVFAALVCSRLGWTAFDGWTAIGVASFIFYTGVAYAREAVDTLLGQKPDPAAVRKISEILADVDGVMGAHEIMVHQYGDVKMVSFHIEVDAGLTLVEAHEIAERAEGAVELELQWRAVAHVDPVDRSHPLFEELNRVVHEFILQEDALVDVHDLRAEGDSAPYRISFDLVTSLETARSEYDSIFEKTRQWLGNEFGQRVSRMEIGLEAAVESAPMARKVFSLPGDGK